LFRSPPVLVKDVNFFQALDRSHSFQLKSSLETAPKRAIFLLSGRLSSSVAKPQAAPVRRAVSVLASMMPRELTEA